jgi:hypothetical protein
MALEAISWFRTRAHRLSETQDEMVPTAHTQSA